VKPNIEETTQIFYEWICIRSHVESAISYGLTVPYSEGQSYWFHKDCHPGGNFLQVVDDNDLPIKKRVRV
jgi:hypothetical protein